MTPYEIGVLLWYHAHGDDHPDLQRDPPVWSSTIELFFRETLLATNDGTRCSSRRYLMTARGHAYCDSLKHVPLPEQQWITRWPTTEVSRGE